MNTTKVFIDQLGREIAIPFPPQRIVSLVPSQTEFLFDVGAGSRVVGTTFFCVHPEAETPKTARIGGTKKLKIEKIKALKPDLIIANKEENVKEQVESLSKEFPVWVSDIGNLDESLEMMYLLGDVLDCSKKASEIISQIQTGFQNLPFLDKKALYLIWRKPWMGAGSDTFISDIMHRLGLQNIVSESRYPELNLEELNARKPDFILLSSEPYPFSQKHLAEIKSFFPEANVTLCDGEIFSWYGSRLLHAPAYFKDFLIER